MNYGLVSLRRKIRKLNPLLMLPLILLLIFYFEVLHSSQGSDLVCPKHDSSKLDLSLEREVKLLRSVLKRHNVDEREYIGSSLPVIYAITPTYARPEQKAELVRLKNTFLHIPSFHWIVIEDAKEKSSLVSQFLKNSSLIYTHLFMPTPDEWKLKSDDPHWLKPRGALQRNKGLEWLRQNTFLSDKGVVYFADDDNTYSVELFQEMRWTERVSVWPVGLVGARMLERPKLNARGKVTGWLVSWKADRPFATDMAGFAINLSLIQSKSNVVFSHLSKRGFMESDFLQKLVTLDELEPKADMCTKVLVWHTQTVKTKIKNENVWKNGNFEYKGIEV